MATKATTKNKRTRSGGEDSPTAPDTTLAAEPASNRKKATRTPSGPITLAPAPTQSTAATSGITLAELGERFLKHLEQAGKSRGTVFSYSLDLHVATRHFGADRAVATITRDQVAFYFASDAVQKNRSGGAKNAITIAKLQRTLRRALVWAAEAGLIAEAPIPPTASEEAKAASATVEARKGTRGRAPNVAFESPIPIAPSAV